MGGWVKTQLGFFWGGNLVIFVFFCVVFMFANCLKKWRGGGLVGLDQFEFFFGFLDLFYFDKTSYLLTPVLVMITLYFQKFVDNI